MISAVVDGASWMRTGDGFYVSLRVRDPAVGQDICKLFADGKPRELTIRQRKRSLDANAYAWALMGRLAAKLRMKPEDVYRHYIPDVAGNCEFVLIRQDAIQLFDEAWCRGHVGRMTEDMGPSKAHKGCHTIRCYYGSSDYDKEQMGRLIDMIVEDCKAQGIETMSDRERSLLVEKWA